MELGDGQRRRLYYSELKQSTKQIAGPVWHGEAVVMDLELCSVLAVWPSPLTLGVLT